MKMANPKRIGAGGFLKIALFVEAFTIALSPCSSQAIEVNDTTIITWEVMAELIEEESVDSHFIDVGTNKGIVTLTGSVDNLLAKERATKVAETVKGVRSVVNLIEVKPVVTSDEQIKEDIQRALLSDPVAELYEITSVEVEHGAVTLRGTVDSWQEQRLCMHVAKGIKGVRKVHNEITVELKMNRLDKEIEAEIRRRLRWDVWVDDALIDVEVKDGTVTLRGRVGSASEKSRAFGDALVAGVTTVDHSELSVDWALRDTMRKSGEYIPTSDEEIEKAIVQAFVYDPRVSSGDTHVEVTDGVATLSGVVGSLKAKRAAGDDAESTVGVWRVKNYLRVRPAARPSDEVIAERVEDAFSRDPYLSPREIALSVQNGKVYLYGTVETRSKRPMPRRWHRRSRG
jgi:osmotically-inducible protein OsmY